MSHATKLTPSSTSSTVTLTSTGSFVLAASASSYPFGLYAEGASNFYDRNFISGAVDQVAYTYKKLGGDVVDIELKQQNVYSSYEEAVLEYSYIVNIHQAKNSLPNMLGNTTGTFDHDGRMLTLGIEHDGNYLSGSNVALKYPKYRFEYTKRMAAGISEEVGLGGTQNVYSASIETKAGQQDYDLQNLISSSAASTDSMLYSDANRDPNKIGSRKITVRRVYYKTPHAMWRFYGYYGGMNSVGNMSTYGMYADDSTFEVIPPWQNKLQAMAYEDAIWTRTSHYSYEIKNNKLRLHPYPTVQSAIKMWVEFTIDENAWVDEESRKTGVDGVNNMNTLPFSNIPYRNINSIGKQWIRRYALALSKEMLGQVRGKFATIPIPGESVTLNAAELLAQAKDEQEKLREELKTILDELTYSKMVETNATMIDAASKTVQQIPAGIFVG